MNLSEAQEFRLCEAGDHAEDALLFRKSQVILKADQVVAVGHEILEPQLHGRIRAGFPVRGSVKPTGFIGPNRNVSTPRRANSSIGRQPSKYIAFSNDRSGADSALTNAS